MSGLVSEKRSIFDWLLQYEYNYGVGVGEETIASYEKVQFKQSLSLAFPASDFHSIENSNNKWLIEQCVIGINGYDGPLPRDWSEELWRDKKTEQAKVAFLDIFNHRLFMLYWRAMANCQMITAVNRKHSLLTKLIDSAAVNAKTSSLSRSSVSRLQALPLWMKKQASVCSLRAMLCAALNVQVNVLEFQPYWLKLEKSDQTEVGIANSWLGHGMVLGSSVLTVTEAICIKLGPLSMEQYSTMTDPKNLQDVFHLIHSFMGRNLVIVLNIGVLIQSPTNLDEMRLGVNSWADSHRERISWDYVQVS